MRGLILLGGDPPEMAHLAVRYAWADLTVAADSGLEAAMEGGLAPDIAVGDFDSAQEYAVRWAREMGCDVRELPAMKDETDGQAALDIALAAGCTQVAMLGGFGGRLDHQYVHLCLLMRAAGRGARAWLEDSHTRVECFGQGVANVQGKAGDTLSILPLGGGLWVERVEGLLYPIPDKELPIDRPFGVSNRMTEDIARVWIRSGTAVVIHIAAL